MKKKTRAKKKPAIPMVMTIPAPEVKASELPEFFEMTCPQCLEHWANAKIDFGQPIRKENFSIRKDLVGRVSFQKGGLPICPMCSFHYTPYAIYSLMISFMARKRMEAKSWGGNQYEKQA